MIEREKRDLVGIIRTDAGCTTGISALAGTHRTRFSSQSCTGNNSKISQIHDLGRQIQHLCEIACCLDPTIPSNEDLESLPVEATTDTSTLISSHLVLFRKVDELQQQNQRLLKIVRDLEELEGKRGEIEL